MNMGGCIVITCFLVFFYRYNVIFLVKCITRTYVMIEEMFYLRFFPHWVCSE